MKWTTRHDRQLTELWLEQPSETIAQQLGVSRRTVTNHAKRLGLPCKTGRRYDLTPLPKETITRLVSRGHTLGQIASELGRDRGCLSIAMRKYMPHTYSRLIRRYRSAGHVTRKRNKEQEPASRAISWHPIKGTLFLGRRQVRREGRMSKYMAEAWRRRGNLCSRPVL